MARPTGQGEKTKQKIAEKAKELFEQKGYVSASMEDICNYTGVSRGSIYFHFKSKEELYLYTLRESIKATCEEWEEKSSSVESATEKLYLLGSYYASDLQTQLSKTVMEYVAAENLSNYLQEEVMKLIKPEYDLFRKVVEEGVQKGEFKADADSSDLALILYGMLQGLSISMYYGYEKERFLNIYNLAIDVFLNGVSALKPEG